MKKIIILAVCLMAAVPCFAQWDIKTFDRIGKNAIIQILGVPESISKSREPRKSLPKRKSIKSLCLVQRTPMTLMLIPNY